MPFPLAFAGGAAAATALAGLIEYFTKKKEEGGVLTGTEGQARSNLTPEQQQSQNQILQQLGPLMKSIGTQPQGNFQDIANNEMFKFNTQTVPSLAERFTAQGAGAQRSSDYAGMLGAAGAGLRSNLASMGAQYQQNQRGQNIDLLRLLMGTGMNQSQSYFQRQPGLIENAVIAAIPAAMGYAGGGAAGGAAGALSSYLSSQGGNANANKINAMQQGQMGGTNDYINNILGNRPMSTQDFFRTSGIMRG